MPNFIAQLSAKQINKCLDRMVEIKHDEQLLFVEVLKRSVLDLSLKSNMPLECAARESTHSFLLSPLSNLDEVCDFAGLCAEQVRDMVLQTIERHKK